MFSKTYPNLNWWIENQGWIEIGTNDQVDTMIRILDEGGDCFEVEFEDAESFDDALDQADRWCATEIEDRIGEEPPHRYD